MGNVYKRRTRRIFVSYITLKNGTRIYAKKYGKKAFYFEVEE